MAIRPILTVPNPILKQVSKPVDGVTNATRALMDDMLETMYDAPGIGLAAIQIGVALNIIVMDLAREGEPKNPQYFVNPKILNRVTGLNVSKFPIWIIMAIRLRNGPKGFTPSVFNTKWTTSTALFSSITSPD